MNNICKLFGIQYPIVQAGMVWNSGWKLAAASSNAGILGLIGAGSMYPEVLREHIQKCKAATSQPFGVNIPLLYSDIEQLIEVVLSEKVKIVFTSAGNPTVWTNKLKSHGITVVHVVSSAKYALKAQNAGVDAVVAEGFEAGGHNGREELTTLTLIPMVLNAVNIPVIAAGGIASGRAMLAMEALGAQGVQIGSRFVASVESSAHENFKRMVVQAKEGDTLLTLKELAPVRLLKNKFFDDVQDLYRKGGSVEDLKSLLGRARAKRGMFEGDLVEGELEIGQVAGQINDIKTVSEIVQDILKEYHLAKKSLLNL